MTQQSLLLSNSKRKLSIILSIGLLVLVLATQCSKPPSTTPFTYQLKEGWPEPIIPDNNPLTKESIALGRALFYDTALSVDSTVSCNSCHFAQFGFAHNVSISPGIKGRLGLRNSGTLTNVAFLPYFNRDGGVRTLDIFASVPLEDHDEMGFNLLLASKRLQENPTYVKAAKSIYNRNLDGFVITRSIASFLRTFISDNSKYDQTLDTNLTVTLTAPEQRGRDLFFGDRAHCSSCHSGILFTDFSFQNNGLLDSYIGKDRGRERLTHDPADEGKFRVATLRNVALTAPYMHNGSLATLQDVLQHYAAHGSHHRNKNPIIDSIRLTQQDQEDIISFLHTLTDYEFINNPAFRLGKI